MKIMAWLGKRRLKYLIVTQPKYTFAFGFVLGVILAVLVHFWPPVFTNFYNESIWPARNNIHDNNDLTYDNGIYDFAYEKWLAGFLQARSCRLDPDMLRYTNETRFHSRNCGLVQTYRNESFQRDIDHFDPRSEAKFLYDKIHVTCLVMAKDIIKATAIRDTWGSHCNHLKFVSSKNLQVTPEMRAKNSSILVQNPVQVQTVQAASEFALLCRSLRQIHAVQDMMQWVLIVPEETFALPENLRFFVAGKNFTDRHYLGHAMKFWNVIYNWADAGYILSKGTLDAFVQVFNTDSACDEGKD